MRAELASLTPCAVPFLSRAAVNLCWYYITYDMHTKYTLCTMHYTYVYYVYCMYDISHAIYA